MRRQSPALTTSLASLTLTACLALSGCGQGSEEGAGGTPSSASAVPGAGATAAATQEAVDCSSLTIDSSSQALPEVTAQAGAEPALTWSGQEAPTNLTVTTLREGSGAEVSEADLITASYAGWQWDSDTTFDSTYTADEQRAKEPGPIAFSLQQVITGWRCGLAGHKVGDQVLMSVPAELGYGDDASSGRPTGTLVFVVEVVDSVDVETARGATRDAAVEGEVALTERGVTVEGDLGSAATVSVGKDAREPTEVECIVLARGAGAPVAETSTVVINLAGVSWSGAPTGQSSWETGVPETMQVAMAGLTGLVGVPQGSRVVVLLPANPSTGQEASAYVMDIEAVA